MLSSNDYHFLAFQREKKGGLFTNIEVNSEFFIRISICDGVDEFLVVRTDGFEAHNGCPCRGTLLNVHRVVVFVEYWMTIADNADLERYLGWLRGVT